MAYLKRNDLGSIFDIVRRNNPSQSILFLIAPSVEALCTLKILTGLVIAEFIPFKIEPVASYGEISDIAKTLFEDGTGNGISTVIFIDCGANIDLSSIFVIPASVQILIIDSHRPLALENIFSNSQVLLLDDGFIEENESDLREAFEAATFSDSEKENHSGVEEDQKHKRKGRRKKQIAREKLLDYYESSWSGEPSSRIALEIADSNHKIDNHVLWLGILGCLETYLMERSSFEEYKEQHEYLKLHVQRLNPDSLVSSQPSYSQHSHSQSSLSSSPLNNSASLISSGEGRIRVEGEFRFLLMRHWNIQDAMRHSRYIVGKLQTWRERGKRRLSELFATMGIPLDACQKDYLVMSTRFKKEFGLKIVRFADEYGLPEVRFPSFVREFGYEMTLAASDVVYSLMSLVEQPGKSLDDLWRNNFSIAFSAISDSSSFPLIKRGIDLAIKQHRILIHELNSVLNHRLLRYGPRFRYAVLRNGSDLAWFTSPQSLVKLAHFIVDAQKTTRKGHLPLLMAAFQSSAGTFLTIGINADGSNSNYFGTAFKRATEEIHARVRHDGFDSTLIEVSSDDLKPFIQTLQSFIYSENDMENLTEEIIRHRDGSVLLKTSILKAEHFPLQPTDPTSICINGAPNFRRTPWNICGVAQPSITGFASIHKLFSHIPNKGQGPVWFCIRDEPVVYLDGMPFVLRESQQPLQNMRAFSGISSSRVENLESRLVQDIASEIKVNNGLTVIHEEHEKCKVRAFLMAPTRIQTTRQVFEELSKEGRGFKYFRVPISHEQSPTESFIDEMLQCFSQICPECPIIFSGGMGVGRTSYAMVIATIYKLHQQGTFTFDYFPTKKSNKTLHLIYNLDKALGSIQTIDWIMKRESLVESLEEAAQGNYQVIRDLIKVLDDGKACKELVDKAIDSCDYLLNIKDQILISRVKYACSKSSNSLAYALDSLERYFSLLVFYHYIGLGEVNSFNKWLHNQRTEIWNMYSSIRKRRSEKLKIFRPIDDLSTLSERHQLLSNGDTNVGESIVIRNRSGIVLSTNTILKSDHWEESRDSIPGAPNFRQIGSLPLFAVGQPTIEGIRWVLEKAAINQAQVVWINMREEPLVYINGEPYVLRDHFATLRNIKVFSGISCERLEGMEDNLKKEVLKEAGIYEDRILVHDEISDQLVATWESVDTAQTPRQVFSAFSGVRYYRIPVTAEDSPDPTDMDVFTKVISEAGPSIIIVNCQMGVGRSTIGTIVCHLIENFPVREHENPLTKGLAFGLMNFKIINSLVRMIPHGIETKDQVDNVIFECSKRFNLIQMIFDHEKEAKEGIEPNQVSKNLRRLMVSLKRYFLLICFASYRNQNDGSFSDWFKKHEEIMTLYKELEEGKLMDKIGCSSVLSNQLGEESWKMVKERKGSVLASMTILKFDHFPGCHRMSLAQKIEGAPNFRSISVGDRRIYGVAMPTAVAIGLVLAQTDSESKISWVCLREEPVIYVNGKPYVLRIARNPNENVAMTGIDTERVELIEKRLKKEIQREALFTNNQVLLHEEDGEGYQSSISKWEPLLQIETMAEVFESIGPAVTYYRLPITDEQAPIPRIFDSIARIVEQSGDIVFNCQMGRGRTTTGMVIATIIRQGPLGSATSPDIPLGSAAGLPNPFLSGEYRLINQLVQFLGKTAKELTDRAIDYCSSLQNLREAIYFYKQKIEQGDRSLWEAGINYLIRYFYLICFTHYYHLGERTRGAEDLGNMEETRDSKSASFSDWLAERREITNLINDRNKISFL